MLIASTNVPLKSRSPWQEDTWALFLREGTSHSSRAATLPYIINRCVSEDIAFVLTGRPSTGYHIRPADITNHVPTERHRFE